MKLYTKTGDKGQTGLIGGTRVPKNDIRIEAYGTVDELNSHVGYLTTFPLSEKVSTYLSTLQNVLFTIGSYLATDQERVALHQASIVSQKHIEDIEKQIDILSDGVPPLEYFVLPGGAPSGAVCHVCRTVARRAERRLFDVADSYPVDQNVLIYVNRLSDYFFALSRYLTISAGCTEVFWKDVRLL
jgi:cob(I)alamin adenosyltransferase